MSLPKNWVNAKLDDLFNLVYGKGLLTKDLTDVGYDVYGANGIIGKYSSYIYENAKIIISCRGAASGAIHKTNPFSYITSNSIVFNEYSDEFLDIDFAKYALIFIDKKTVITGTAQPQITIQLLKDLVIPLPPLQEQKRIVAKLDEAFQHHELLKAKLDRIPKLLKNFKQTILTHAVTGKLTKDWRIGKVLKNWESVPLSNMIKDRPRNGYSPNAVDYETPVKSLSLSATTSGIFKKEHVKYLDIKEPDINSHLWLKNGDILIQRSNSLEFVGTAAIYTGDDNEFIYPDLMMKVQANDKIKMKYLYYVLSSKSSRNYFKENATGTSGNMPKINQSTLNNLAVNLPDIEEQNEIVKKVESLFTIADKIKLKYQVLKEKLDNLPQALLVKAFKGELVSQLPTDGDAKDLLAEIQAIKNFK